MFKPLAFLWNSQSWCFLSCKLATVSWWLKHWLRLWTGDTDAAGLKWHRYIVHWIPGFCLCSMCMFWMKNESLIAHKWALNGFVKTEIQCFTCSVLVSCIRTIVIVLDLHQDLIWCPCLSLESDGFFGSEESTWNDCSGYIYNISAPYWYSICW